MCVVCAAGGYPAGYDRGKEITGLTEVANDENVVVFHAGTKRVGRRFLTDGGRVLGITALGVTCRDARDRAYNAVGGIEFEDMYFRTDIAERAIDSEG